LGKKGERRGDRESCTRMRKDDVNDFGGSGSYGNVHGGIVKGRNVLRRMSRSVNTKSDFN
jgi:hypothetical protein